jgi:hypothetical protein
MGRAAPANWLDQLGMCPDAQRPCQVQQVAAGAVHLLQLLADTSSCDGVQGSAASTFVVDICSRLGGLKSGNAAAHW